jgi:SET domain-containing protein 6
MRATKRIGANEQIFNDYGEIPRADLLRRYGYVTDNYATYDVVELPLELICQVAGLADAVPEHHTQVLWSIPLVIITANRLFSSNYSMILEF